ncbi:MAG: hypothetical protein ABFR97_09835 [Thermodesulfobacteriota bacterium]
MVKMIGAALLALLCLLLLKVNVDTLLSARVVEMPEVKRGKKEQLPRQEKLGPFNPRLPKTLPDLNSGYLFNAERHIDTGQAAGDEQEGQGEAAHVNVYEVSYDGSLIAGDVRLGLISYPLQQARKSRRKTRSSRGAQRGSLRVQLGNKVGGYKVEAIEVERILFRKGEEEVEKFLNDNEKLRTKVSRPAPGKRPAPRKTAPPPKMIKKIPARPTANNRKQVK